MDLSERFGKIVKVNGRDFQFEIAIEEASEFIHSVQKYKRGKCSIHDVLEEMADVYVTFECLKRSLRSEVANIEDGIMDTMNKKTEWIEDYDGKADKSLTWQDFKSG